MNLLTTMCYNCGLYFEAIKLFIVVGEETVDGRHNLRPASPKELPETMLSIFLSFLFIIQHSCKTVRFVDPVNKFQPKQLLANRTNSHVKSTRKEKQRMMELVPDFWVQEHVSCKLEGTQASYKCHCTQ